MRVLAIGFAAGAALGLALSVARFARIAMGTRPDRRYSTPLFR